MKVRIDYDLCMGDGNCAKVCPQVFRYNDDKLRAEIPDPAVPPHLEAKVRQAAEECDPQAIVIEE